VAILKGKTDLSRMKAGLLGGNSLLLKFAYQEI
jgi:hypothetical protein